MSCSSTASRTRASNAALPAASVTGCDSNGHAVEAGEIAQVPWLDEHERDVDRQLPGALAEQQVVEAVGRGRDEDEGAQRATDVVDVVRHPEPLDDRSERPLELVARRLRLDLQPHEEAAGVGARELLALGDVAAGRDDRAADGVHDAGTVGAD